MEQSYTDIRQRAFIEGLLSEKFIDPTAEGACVSLLGTFDDSLTSEN
jgi:hypothetical protein